MTAPDLGGGAQKNVTPTNEIRGDRINGARQPFAAVIPHNRWKWTGSLRLPDQPLKREIAARESDQLWLGALGPAMTDRGDDRERNSRQAKEDCAPIQCRCGPDMLEPTPLPIGTSNLRITIVIYASVNRIEPTLPR